MAYTPIDNSAEHFKAVKYTGNSTEPRNIDVGFQSDFVWVKDGTIAYYPRIFDSNRVGAGPLYPSEDKAEDHHNDGPEIDFSSPYSNGFKIIDNPDGTTNSYGVNQNSSEMISWNWKANGGTTSSNTSGNITSTVQANTDAGFSIVTYTGNGNDGATVGHGLGVAPSMVIFKCRDTGNTDWRVYHKTISPANAITLSGDGNKYGASSVFTSAFTSTTLNLENDAGGVNKSGSAMIAYCFAPKQGFSRFGFHRGNGSTNGPFVYTGFKPAFLMFKQTTGNGNAWFMFDNARSTFNGVMPYLRANATDTSASGDLLRFMSNGYKLLHNDSAFNGDNHDYLYMAFAENPFVTSGGAPTTAR
tara:strand:+ start:60 stop:1133 length:1074 start_codon:yes stop_codon:yes gene_type:complete